MWTPASFRANVMTLKKLNTPPPRERYLRSLFAFLAFLCVLLSCVSLFGVGDYSPLEKIRVITSADSPFRLPLPFSDKPTLKNSMHSKISRGKKKFNNYSFGTNGSRSQIPKMCSDIFSIGKKRSTMTPVAKTIVSYLRSVKSNPSNRRFLRHEPYFILGDMIPVILNVTTTSDNVTEVNYNKEWRMEQVAGLFPHLSCQLRDYTTVMFKQCLVNRRKRGKATKLLFMGDSRVRQFVEAFLDVFRDMDFEIATQEGDVLALHDFLGLDVEALWSKYKKRFVATSKQTPDIKIEYYWTTIFGLKVQNINVAEPGINRNASALLAQMEIEDIRKGTPNNTHAIFREYLNQMTEKATKPPPTNSSTPINSPGPPTPRRTSVSEALKTTVGDHHRQLIDEIINDIPSTSFENGSHVDSETSRVLSGKDLTVPLEQILFKSEPLKRLKELLTVTPTEVPDLVILGSDVWGLDNYDRILLILDEITVRQVAQLRPLLLRLRAVTQLVWVMPTPIKDHMYQSYDHTAFLTNVFMRNVEWIASAQVQLMAQGITVWDSFFPIAHASLRDCVESYQNGNVELPPHPKLGLLTSWYCGDRVHNNNEAFVVAVQMMANQLCNGYMPHEGYCCEK